MSVPQAYMCTCNRGGYLPNNCAPKKEGNKYGWIMYAPKRRTTPRPGKPPSSKRTGVPVLGRGVRRGGPAPGRAPSPCRWTCSRGGWSAAPRPAPRPADGPNSLLFFLIEMHPKSHCPKNAVLPPEWLGIGDPSKKSPNAFDNTCSVTCSVNQVQVPQPKEGWG